jgi:hypothetical protein
MITRQEFIDKLKIGMKVQTEKNKFNSATDEGQVKLSKIYTDTFVLVWKKKNGAVINEPLGAGYRYDIDNKKILTYHNDRTEGWTVVERKKIISGGNKL